MAVWGTRNRSRSCSVFILVIYFAVAVPFFAAELLAGSTTRGVIGFVTLPLIAVIFFDKRFRDWIDARTHAADNASQGS
ncbi:hypothetical protein GCM10011410_06590 [Hoyosella rhizosphaerae]|uniref:Uncharacterized protein n=1 Tax=Hoyosella rhizosphaerae TaxID=1755582 RepID=A0A916XAB4_9ACTN|nr:hypothetical protein GCM10011410_06590 [Hoyosella rhizosphaerae]